MRDKMRFNRGTSEYMVVEVVEELGEITSLGTATFDIYHSNDTNLTSPVVTASTAVIIDGLKVRCLIQPQINWVVGYYILYLNLAGLPTTETPRLGPIEFVVEA
jgi:hypothetical protein